jgi:hypothetical protein
MRKKIELEVIGKKKLRPICLMDIEWELLKSCAELLGWSISEYVGMALCKVNAEVNAEVSSLLFGVDSK